MAQKHNWSKKKGDAWCTRKGCARRRVSVGAGAVIYGVQATPETMTQVSAVAGECGGDVPKTEKSGKHDWEPPGYPGVWRPCRNKDCPWEFDARKEKYRVRGATVLGEKRKPDPCKGAP